MKRLALLSLAIFIAGVTSAPALSNPHRRAAISIAQAPAGPAVLATANFVTAEKDHPTQGTVRILEEKGKRYVEFSADFKTVEGPAVAVILHRGHTVAVNIHGKDYITLAPLRSFTGAQRYEIPPQVNLADFGSVAIWCGDFNVTFGYAPL
ncbi:MAG: DM13 domain-containing protein [Chloroflexaceae bacterium]|nr:DM13 domain-containing protein [Chloroflexaceae bacterium]